MTGEILGHFEILDTLAEGGMGVLYRARDTRLGRTVAIKLLRSEVVADPERTRRFLQEAKAASALNHPCIVTVHDIGQDPKHGTYIAMECVEGESLRQRLARGRLPTSEAVRIALEVARGLAAAHAAGIVHRDVKPGNVMITDSGFVKLLDFGLAKLVSPAESTTDSEATTLSVAALTELGALLGTPAYMSPEQATSRPVDARSDVFSFGAVLFEMLTGRRAFEGTGIVLLSSILRDAPPPVRGLCPEVDPGLEKVVDRCLRKDPAARYPSARELVLDLEACLARDQPARGARRLRRRAWSVGVGVPLVLLLALGAWAVKRSVQESRALREVVPEIQRLVDSDDLVAGFYLAESVRPLLEGDPRFDKLWVELTAPASVSTEPAGAEVSVRPYSKPDSDWRKLGVTPIAHVDLPRGFACFRIEKPGYLPVDLAFSPMVISRLPAIRLVPLDEAPPGMVLVPGGIFQFHAAPTLDLPEFWLDRYEVTNREFGEFVQAGGYRRHELWKHPFVHHDRHLSFDEAMALFRDLTGRPGPATWELGNFPEGRADYPVSGVSWYEAAAYAEFAGKSLPTLHHWYRAADLSRFSEILQYSNFGGEEPQPCGQRPSLTSFGNFDMAGNVREWVWNEAAVERRYTLGGAWSDPTYLYTGPDALDPMDRSPILGFRCARYLDPPPEAAFAPVKDVISDFSNARPVGDEIFRVYRGLFDYDAIALDARVESVDESSEYWRAEKVSFTAAYGGERIVAWLYLPKNATPPYQAVVYFPPGSALYLRSIDDERRREFGFLVRSGRALLFPAYQGTYERRRSSPGLYAVREVYTQRGQDVRRAIDFLEERSDIDHARIAYYGLSMGAKMGPIVGAVEDRVRALVLVAGGLEGELPAEVDMLHYAPRVHQPVLMINGRHDFLFPHETTQRPLFLALGTAEKDKKQVVFESGHVPPWPDVVRETLDWLDLYLGPVVTAPLATP